MCGSHKMLSRTGSELNTQCTKKWHDDRLNHDAISVLLSRVKTKIITSIMQSDISDSNRLQTHGVPLYVSLFQFL